MIMESTLPTKNWPDNNRISMGRESANLEGLNILLGVSGGVSAYKAVDLASKLTAAGANLKTIMTENACQLIMPKSFEAVTGEQVYTSIWSSSGDFKISHVNLVDWADMVVVAPATANIIGKVAGGICDDLLSTTLCVCWQKPALMAPAMNNNMWENPAVQRNVKAIQEAGFKLTGPQEGRLACGDVGAGRMTEPAEIIRDIEQIASQIKKKN